MKTTDVYEHVTETILAKLKEGVAPWASPYLAGPSRWPMNYQSKQHYNGINPLLLACAGFVSPYWLTYKQAQALGGQVRRGEKGTKIVKAGSFQKKTGQLDANGEEMTEEGRYLRLYTVFNAAQIDGIEFPEPPALKKRDRWQTIDAAEAIVNGMPKPPVIDRGQYGIAYYDRSADRVQVPSLELMTGDAEFYSTLFHELVHSTGHSERLERESLIKATTILNNRSDYSKEELVAEMGAAFLSARAGIVADDHANSAAYLKGWAEKLSLKDNRKWILSAASQAGKAAAYILGE